MTIIMLLNLLISDRTNSIERVFGAFYGLSFTAKNLLTYTSVTILLFFWYNHIHKLIVKPIINKTTDSIITNILLKTEKIINKNTIKLSALINIFAFPKIYPSRLAAKKYIAIIDTKPIIITVNQLSIKIVENKNIIGTT